MLDPRGPLFRSLAVLTALCFLNLELSALVGGRLVVPPAQAAGKDRRVALFVFPAKRSSEDQAKVLQTLMRDTVAKLAGVRVTTGSPDPQTSIVAEAGPLVEDGFRALNVRDAARAQAAFTSAYDKLVRHTGRLDKRLMARTLKGFGVAKALAGQGRAGQDYMRASLLLWPDQQPPEYGYTLDVLNLFKEVQRQVAEQQPGGVEISTVPAGAEVAVDGKVRGYSPITVTDLPPGLHWVSAQLDGYVRAGEFVDVQPGGTASTRVALRERDGAAAYNDLVKKLTAGMGRAATAQATLPALASTLGADEAVALELDVRGSTYKLDGWYAKGAVVEPVSATFKVDANLLPNLEGLLVQTLKATPAPEEGSVALDAPPTGSVVAGGGEEDLIINPDDPILKTRDKDKKKPITSEWWFWVIVGGVAAGVAVGGVLLFSGSGEGKGPVGDIGVTISRLP